MFTIYIERWHPTTINKLLGSHFGMRHKMKKVDAEMIAAYSRHVPKAVGKRKVEIMIYVEGKGRRADPDAYFKSTLDALVKNRLLTDDNSQGCELLPLQIHNGKQATMIRLYEAN